jgi:hypothetical protein
LDGNKKATKEIEMSSSDEEETKMPAQDHIKVLNYFGSTYITSSIQAVRTVPLTKSDYSI